MLNSEPHKETVLKILKQAYVSHNASVDKIDRLVENVMMDNYISFSDDKFHPMVMVVQRLCISLPRSKTALCPKS